MREFKLVNADVLIRSHIDVDDFIDVIEGNKNISRYITCLTKVDLAAAAAVEKRQERAECGHRSFCRTGHQHRTSEGINISKDGFHAHLHERAAQGSRSEIAADNQKKFHYRRCM